MKMTMKLTPLEWLRNIAMILFGSAVMALGFDMFLDPNDINCGGVAGISMLVLHVTQLPWLSLGMLTIAFNIPMFLLGFKKIGRYFFLTSLLGMLTSSVLYDVFRPLAVAELDPLVAAIFGGVMIGAGLGVVFLAGASTGGTDIVARLLKLKWRDFPLGKIVLSMDICITFATGIVYHDLTNTLYSIVTLYLSSVVMDKVIYSLDFAKVALIISDRYEQIAAAIDSRLARGVTLLNGQGYYRRQDKYVLLSVVRQRQLAQLKELVFELDPDAFIIMQDARQVLGDGFKRYDRFEL